MTEMGIQMEVTRLRNGTMHRAITRKPRVSSKSKPNRFSSRSSEDSELENLDEKESDRRQLKRDISPTLQDVHHLSVKKRVSTRKRCSAEHVKENGNAGEASTELSCKPLQEGHEPEPPTTNTKERGRTREPSTRKRIGRTRALSVDNIPRNLPARAPSFLSKKPIGHQVEDIDYDPGSQILDSYSNSLSYDSGTPKYSKGKRVKSFFRRLAGSLESLLGLKRKSSDSSDRARPTISNSIPSSEKSPKPANLSPFAVPEKVSTEAVASIETTTSTNHSTDSSNAAVIDKEASNKSPQEGHIHRRRRQVYLPHTEKTEPNLALTMTPVPPRKPGGRRSRALRKTRLRRSHHAFRGNSEFTDLSQDWETRSDTDSEGFAFQSNKLVELGMDSMQSEMNDSDKLLAESSNGIDEESVLMSSNAVKCSIPVKISDFRPPSNLTRQLSRHRNKESTKSKGPMKALQPSDMPQNLMTRSESTGKFDNSKREKKKVRRRNSSFVPEIKNKSPVLSHTALKEALSFEQIMSSINSLADKLDKASMSSSTQLHKQSTDTDLSAVNDSLPQDLVKPKPPSVNRNQSWVGRVSSRLDNLIEPNKPSNKASGMKMAPTSTNFEQHNEPRHKTFVRKKNPSIIKKEKISFDDLESDFLKFAKEVRERKRSNDKVNLAGQ